jgi:hypothetical protein
VATMTARIEEWLREDVETFWQAHGEKPSAGLRRVIQEWWAAQHFPALSFRDGVSGRRAVLRDGPDVWEVAMVARDYGDDRDGFYAHFAGFVARDALDQALEYAERFPEEIAGLLAENARVERLLGDAG